MHLTQSQSQSNFSTISNKPKLVKYVVNKKTAGLGQKITRQHHEAQLSQEDAPMDTVKSLQPSRPQTQQSFKSDKIKTDQDARNRAFTPKSQSRVKTMEFHPEDLSMYQFIDEIPIDHPIWKTVLPEESVFNIPKLIEENQEYFQHLLGFCSCYKCQCGQCKCNFAKNIKFNLNSNKGTIYKNDFRTNASSFNSLMPLNQTYYNTKFNDQKTIDFQSLNRDSYKFTKTSVQSLLKPKSREHKGDFIGNSCYRQQFNNWGPPDTEKFKRPVHISICEAPFTASSLYQDSYVRGNNKKSEQFRMTSELTPLPTGQTFAYKTQNQIAYQPFKILSPVNLKEEFPTHFEKAPRYDLAFKSLSNTEYTPKLQKACPAKEYNRSFQKHLLSKQQLANVI